MDRFRQKSRKEKPAKNADRDKPPLFITDVKSIKENLKIKEILRTVKMNSSMRIKAPRGSKVMHNKDFNDNDEDMFEDTPNAEDPCSLETPSAINPDVIVNDSNVETTEKEIEDDVSKSEGTNNESINESYENNSPVETTIHESPAVPEGLLDDAFISQENKQYISTSPDVKNDLEDPNDYSLVKTRERKLSLDQTMLCRREGLSQSELDLNSIGKSPLERKSSFFRKKMDSFLRNTTEIFKRQSISKSQSSIQRRGSMSVSMQSLNENSACNGDFDAQVLHTQQEELQGSVTSLRSSVTCGRSNSSLSYSDQVPASPDAASLPGSQPLGGYNSNSIHSLNEAYIQESLLNSRAISMSSGLDSAHGQDRRKANRSNRVTWVASEGLTNYLRRVIQDEKSREIEMCHSFQDFSSIPESNPYGTKTDSKGRRLSYQRAVSGEDPVTRHQDSSLRRKPLIPENSEVSAREAMAASGSNRPGASGAGRSRQGSPFDPNDLVTNELVLQLSDYKESGVPALKGFTVGNISDQVLAYLQWAQNASNFEEIVKIKSLPAAESSRQAVIRELIHTEANYIRHLTAVVEVFIATAHALQDSGKLLYLETEKLFTNIPDVLIASLRFWESVIYPMLDPAVRHYAPFNTELMVPGFYRFADLLQPYEKYVNEQTKALDYLRSLTTQADFMTYLHWCHSQNQFNRLQLSDIMVKPMQRLTKYGLLLNRIIQYTDSEPERSSLILMESFAKNYVLDLNRSIRQREELEKMNLLAQSIETYEVDFRDEEIDRCFRMYALLNLKAPMVNCLTTHSRTIIYQGDLRFKDNLKEVEVRVFLFTDMMLICKKLSKGSLYQYKMIRPKYMIDKMLIMPRCTTRNNKDIYSIICLIVDDVNSSCHAFALTESSKDSTQQGTLKVWDQKLREARLTYELGVSYARNPRRDLSEVEMDSSSDYAFNVIGAATAAKMGIKQNSEDVNIEREARERLATMLHRGMGTSTEHDVSQVSMTTESFDGEAMGMSTSRPLTMQNLRHPMTRNSTGGSSRNSRLSSFQQSTSAASYDEPQPGPSGYHYRAGSFVEHVISPQNPEDGVTSIIVNVVSESEPETVVDQPHAQRPSLRMLQHSLPRKSPMPSRSSSANRNTLRPQPQNVVLALVNSLPDLTLDPTTQPPRQQSPSPTPKSASDILYQSHQELLQRNRLSASQQMYLSPDNRGSSYPPLSPTSRASLKRGLAFSQPIKYPPLLRMGHVNSQSQQLPDVGPSTSQGAQCEQGSVSPVPNTSTEKGDIEAKHVSSGQKGDGDGGGGGGGGGGSGSGAGPSRKDDKADKAIKEEKTEKKDKAKKKDKESKKDKTNNEDTKDKEDKEDKVD